MSSKAYIVTLVVAVPNKCKSPKSWDWDALLNPEGSDTVTPVEVINVQKYPVPKEKQQ